MTTKNVQLSRRLFELHPAQQNVYFEQLIHPDSPMHNIGLYTDGERPLQLDILQRSWALLYQHMDALRLTFCQGDDGMVMQSVKPSDSHCQVAKFIDFSDHRQPLQSAKQWMQQQLDTPMDYLGGQTCTIALVQLSAEKSLIFNCFHHLNIDGVGFYVLHHWLYRVYETLAAGEQTGERLAELTADLEQVPQYIDSVQLAHKYLESDRYQQDKRHWRDFVSDKPVLRLTPVASRVESRVESRAEKVLDTEIITQALDKPTSDAIRVFCKEYRVSPLSLLIAVGAVYFNKITGQPNQLLGTAMHGRKGKQQMGVIGMFSNPMLVSCHVKNNSTFVQLSKAVSNELRCNLRHRLR
ncbi:MAG: hypothetical protein HRT35_33990, partial [Algicola sp.]|nr:hypothetical protein [Algicola sp.]